MLNFAPNDSRSLDGRGHLLEVEGNLGHQDHVGAAGDAGVQRDPAGVAAHHLDHHDPLVRFRRRVQPVDRLGRKGDTAVSKPKQLVVPTMSLSIVFGTPTTGMPFR